MGFQLGSGQKRKWQVANVCRLLRHEQSLPKDNFLLLKIDQLVDSTVGYYLLSFMVVYSGYNQIPMYLPNQDHNSFRTDLRLYCYLIVPFSLKNAGATYQRLVNQVFKE